jgi:PAS domain S-box-containing protein
MAESENPRNGTRARLPLWRPTLALALPVVACMVQWRFQDYFRSATWFLFYPTVFFSSLLGGVYCGIAATAISAALTVYCFIPPEFSFVVAEPSRWVSTILFLVFGTLMSLSHGRLWRANREVREAKGRLESRVAERTAELERQAQATKDSLKEVHDMKAALDEHAIVAITDPQGRITFVNERFCSISGYSREEVLGQDHRLLNSGRHPKEFFAEMWSTILAGKVWHGEICNKTKSGSFYWVEATIVPFLDDRGQVRQFVAIRSDITERKRVEVEQQKLVAELARSNAELEQFAYAASHDLQEPLRAVAGCAQLLQQRYRGQMDARADQFIGEIVDGATRMQHLISDLLDFSRVTTRGHPLEPMASAEALEAALKNLSTATMQSGATITHDPLPEVLADAMQLTRLFQNLIGNAIKFRGSNPPRIHIHASSADLAWRFSVKDNGIGIDSKHFEKVFVLFQRLHTRREYPGTGLGLALCRKIVERHGGSIWVESQPGQGSTFFFTLQAAKCPSRTK